MKKINYGNINTEFRSKIVQDLAKQGRAAFKDALDRNCPDGAEFDIATEIQLFLEAAAFMTGMNATDCIGVGCDEKKMYACLRQMIEAGKRQQLQDHERMCPREEGCPYSHQVHEHLENKDN